MAIVFNGNQTKNSPEAFPGVVLKSYIHPDGRFHDGYDISTHGTPKVNFSFGLFTIEPGHIWPATRFDIVEVSYCLEGEGIWICDGKEFDFKPGYVIYVSSAEVRIIKNTSTVPLKYLCIVDPAWQPEYETVL